MGSARKPLRVRGIGCAFRGADVFPVIFQVTIIHRTQFCCDVNHWAERESGFVECREERDLAETAGTFVLAGGLDAADVTFNIIGKGSTVKISGESLLCGTLNALDRYVQISSDSTMMGIVNAAQVTLLSGGVIIPPVASP